MYEEAGETVGLFDIEIFFCLIDGVAQDGAHSHFNMEKKTSRRGHAGGSMKKKKKSPLGL